MSTFLNQQTFAVAPIMSGANIASNTIPLASVVGGTSLPTLAGTQTWTGVDTFTQTVHAPSYTISDANGNVFVGTGLNASTFSVTGNVGLGVNSFGSMTTASGNLAIGGYAFAQLATGTQNIALGDHSGANVGGGDHNTFLGAYSGIDAFAGPFSYSTGLGYSAIVNADHQIMVGTVDETTFIPGNLNLTLNGATNGYVLTTDGSGNATWAAGGGGGGGDAYLADDQTWTGINTYTTAPVFSAASSALQITTGAANNLLLASDASGNATWSNAYVPIQNYLSSINAPILIGSSAGSGTNGLYGVAIGVQAANANLADYTVVIGVAAGRIQTRNGAVLIGSNAGESTVGTTGLSSVAIGLMAGQQTLADNSIILNASGAPLNSANTGFFVNPVRTTAGTTPLAVAYDTTNNEFMVPSGPLVVNGLNLATGAVSGYVLTSDGSGNGSWQAGSSPLAATVSTTNATATTLATIAVPSNQSVIISGYVVARNTSGTINDATGGEFVCTAVNTAGTVALASTPNVVVQATSTGSFNVVVSGTNLIVQVTGIAATNYSWKASYSVVVI
jgi:hypothetical protein